MRFSAAVLILLLVFSLTASAGTQDNAKLALHVAPTCDKCIHDVCGTYSPVRLNTPCSSYSTEYRDPGGAGYRAFLLVAQADALAGVSQVRFGIEWDLSSINPFGWTPCGDSEVMDPGFYTGSGGNLISWDPTTNCQRAVIGSDGAHALVGAFYLYSYGPGEFKVVPDPAATPQAFMVADCNGEVSYPAFRGGSIGDGEGFPGYNPCLTGTPVQTTRWGTVKALYGSTEN